MLEKITALLEKANNDFDINMAKIDVYVESTLDLFAINCKKAELKVLTESGSPDDLFFFENEANKGAVESIKKAIDKIIEAFTKFVNEIKLKILTFINKKETKNVIDEMEKKIKFNPFLSNKQVQVEDTKKQLKVVAWANAELTKLISKVKSGKTVLAEEVNKLGEEFKRRLQSASGIENAVKVKLKEAASMLKKASDAMNENIEHFSKITKELIEDAKTTSGELHTTVSNTLKMIASKASEVGKEALNIIVNFCRSTFAVIRNTVSKIKNNEKDGKPVEESVVENNDRPVIENTSEADEILLAIESELFADNTTEEETIEENSVEESTTDDSDDWMKMFEEDVLN